MSMRYFIVLLLFFLACNQPEKSTIDLTVPGLFLRGDFNGDGKYEYAWLQYVKYDSNGNCEPNCEEKILFSDHLIPIIHTGAEYYGGSLFNQGDLNNDGADEISFIPYGDASEWSYCALFTLRNGNWSEPVKSFAVFGTGGDYIEQDSMDKEFIFIHSFDYDEERGITDTIIKTRMK